MVMLLHHVLPSPRWQGGGVGNIWLQITQLCLICTQAGPKLWSENKREEASQRPHEAHPCFSLLHTQVPNCSPGMLKAGNRGHTAGRNPSQPRQKAQRIKAAIHFGTSFCSVSMYLESVSQRDTDLSMKAHSGGQAGATGLVALDRSKARKG